MITFKYKKLTLYNKDELNTKLELENGVEEEIIVKGYDVRGETLFSKLNGDFAFAFYDPSEDILYATRDALGVKELYYSVVNETYYFSDDIDVLFFQTKMKKIPNLKSMKTVLSQTTIEYEETMYEGIKRIPPGHYLKVMQKEAILMRYWYPEEIDINYSITLDEASAQFKRLFQKAIESRIGTDEETAYELSGGVDSSSIVSMVKKLYPQKEIDTYTMSFRDLGCDESAYVEVVEKQYQFNTHNIASQNIDYQNGYDFKFNYRVNPHWPVTTTFTMLFPMVESMYKDGKRIIISGQGGDHLLTGSCRVLADLLKRRAFKKLLKEIGSGGYAFVQFIGCALLPLFRGKISRKIKKIIFSPFNKNSQTKKETIIDLFSLYENDNRFKVFDMNALFTSNHSLIMDGNALHALEKMYKVEFRHPFFDKNLVEFVISLPPEYRYSQGWTKMLLRYAMEDTLVDIVRSRQDKAEFSEVILQQLQAIDVKKLLQDASIVSLGLIDQDQVDNVLYLFEKKIPRFTFLWRLVNLEYWYTNVTKGECSNH